MRGCLLFLLLCPATLVSARVFWRQPASLPQSWDRAYSAPVRLQNGKGQFDTFISRDALPEIETRLREEHGEDLVWLAGEVMAWGMALTDGWLTRYLVQPLPDGGFWIARLHQPERQAGKPGDKPDRHQLKDLPVYPQSKPSFYSHDEGNQLTVEISECTAGPEAALQTLARMVEEAGWSPSPVNTGGFQVFVRGDRVAFLGAKRGKDGITRILRLHKPLGVE
ncbi:MAG: hypothetical protein WD490_08660 [Opitutales bacterium]